MAKKFLCAAMIKEAAAEYGEAAWGYLYAAWAYDDAGAGAYGQMLSCRRNAITFFLKERSAGIQPTATTPIEATDEDLRLADLMRRVGSFEQAAKLCQDALASAPPGNLQRLLAFELELIANRDMACHRTGEVLETEEERQERWRREHPSLRKRVDEAVHTLGCVLALGLVLCVGVIYLPLEWLVRKILRREDQPVANDTDDEIPAWMRRQQRKRNASVRPKLKPR